MDLYNLNHIMDLTKILIILLTGSAQTIIQKLFTHFRLRMGVSHRKFHLAYGSTLTIDEKDVVWRTTYASPDHRFGRGRDNE